MNSSIIEKKQRLEAINPLLAKLADGIDLTSEESEKLFSRVFLYDTEGFYFTTLMSSIHAKGETPDELLGLLNVYKKFSTKLEVNVPTNKITDLSGTGGGSFKTINVSTAASFIVAAAGYTVCKASYYGVTSPTGSADIFAAFGIDISKLTKEIIEETLNEVRICPYYTFYISPKLENRGRLFKKVYKDSGIKVKTIAHLTTNAFSPFSLNHRIYGCYSEKYLETLANLFMKLGFKRTLTFYSAIGLAEISNVGKTTIVEQDGKKIKKYNVTPQDLGVKEAKTEDIEARGREQNIIDFLDILRGKKGAKADLVCLNAGAALYALEGVKSLNEGFKKAKKIQESGQGYLVLEKLVKKIGSINSLNQIDL